MRAPEVHALVVALTERVGNLRATLDELKDEQKQAAKELVALRLEHEKALESLKRDVAELQKGRDVWGNRAFTVALVVAILGTLLTNIFRKP